MPKTKHYKSKQLSNLASDQRSERNRIYANIDLIRSGKDGYLIQL